jgi:hypothetical protein
VSLELAAALALLITCVVGLAVCAIIKRRKPTLLQAPERAAIREVYEHAHRVGNMRGVK